MGALFQKVLSACLLEMGALFQDSISGLPTLGGAWVLCFLPMLERGMFVGDGCSVSEGAFSLFAGDG